MRNYLDDVELERIIEHLIFTLGFDNITQNLILTANNLENLQFLNVCGGGNIQELMLSRNKITTIELSDLFTKLPNLKILDLS